MMKKTLIILLALTLVISAGLTGCSSSGSDATASVQSVSMIAGIGSTGLYDTYAGVIVARQTIELTKDDTKTISEMYVAEGDAVTVGQKLFAYDLEDMQLSLDKARLELEQLNNSITSYKSQKTQLEKEKKSAPASQQLEYSIEIQSLEADIREAEYNVALKEADIERMEADIGSPDVTSEVSGVVQSINENNETDPNTGAVLPFMTIVETGAYRVKGTINEAAAGSLAIGAQVIIRSRVDSELTWVGAVDSIDWENPISNNNYYYYESSGDEMTTSSKYPFYITLDSSDGLILGQHVYIEPNLGQESGSDGIWLPSYYINDVDSGPWVWAATSKDKLEKRDVELGEYNADLDTYEITGGLTADDYIAYPDDTLEAGMAVTYYDEDYFDTGGNTDDGTGSGAIDGSGSLKGDVSVGAAEDIIVEEVG